MQKVSSVILHLTPTLLLREKCVEERSQKWEEPDGDQPERLGCERKIVSNQRNSGDDLTQYRNEQSNKVQARDCYTMLTSCHCSVSSFSEVPHGEIPGLLLPIYEGRL